MSVFRHSFDKNTFSNMRNINFGVIQFKHNYLDER